MIQPSYVSVHHIISVSYRQELIDRYNNDGNILVFLLSTKAGECVCVCACVRERERVCVCERERECVCV